jgi:predicted secreted protein
MEWRKTRISTTRWDAGNEYRITQDLECAGDQFRLESFADPDGEVEYFATLDQAKSAARLRHELNLAKAENAHLRAELALARDAAAFGRGIPTLACNGHSRADASADRAIEDAVAAGPRLAADADEPF